MKGRKPKGFVLRCPRCRSADGLYLSLDDLRVGCCDCALSFRRRDLAGSGQDSALFLVIHRTLRRMTRARR